MKINIYVTYKKSTSLINDAEYVLPLGLHRRLWVNIKDAAYTLTLERGKKAYLFGEVFYHIKNAASIDMLNATSTKYLSSLFRKESLANIITQLEGQYVGVLVDEHKQKARIFSDRYARLDTFYAQTNKELFLSNDLGTVFKWVKPVYSQKMLAHLFSVYGWYTPKGLTIYENVRQLKVGEIITVSPERTDYETVKFEPLKIKAYGESELETYYTMLRDAICSRVNGKKKVWVSSSSGWDSSIILGMLVNEFGAHAVDMLAGSMKYSKGTDVINKFEITKIKNIAKFYGIKPTIVDLDFKSKRAPAYWQKSLPFWKSRHIYTYVTLNFATISDGIARIAGPGQIVFNGETSDSFHNFGFSQFATFFHTQKSFTEYADKMNCYLYGPSFFKKVLAGNYIKDKVYQIFTKMMDYMMITPPVSSKKEIINSYLFPFFHGSPRIPFARTHENPIFTEEGKKAIFRFPYYEYIPEVLTSINEKNMYAWFIYLYHMFHAQGSTTNIHKHGAELNNHRWRSPFNDYRLITLLSQAPEAWGRGLEFSHTKYPLKWVARHKIKFPYALLDEGPHSYLYDVIEGFSLYAEKTYRSGVTNFFKDAVATRPYKNILSDEYINVSYLDTLVADYLDGKEARGKDFHNLVSLITLCTTGWY